MPSELNPVLCIMADIEDWLSDARMVSPASRLDTIMRDVIQLDPAELFSLGHSYGIELRLRHGDSLDIQRFKLRKRLERLRHARLAI